MKNHLKRIAAPATWNLNRKEEVFSCRPNPGGHSFEQGLPLAVVLRDYLHLAGTMDETKKLLIRNEVFVDGKRRKDPRYLIGLFDTLAIPTLQKYYRIVFDARGRIAVIEINEEESALKLCKVLNKKVLPGGKIQLNLHDGKNVLVDKKVNVGDSLLLTLPKFELKDIIPLQKGVQVYLTKGKNCGDFGYLKEIKGQDAVYTSQGKDTETSYKYIFVVGKEKPILTLHSTLHPTVQS